MSDGIDEGLKVVQIDDAGIGSPVGGAVIGMLDVETSAFSYGMIDVEYFQDGKYASKEYQNRTVEIIDSLFRAAGITRETHRVEICSGHIFDRVRIWLDDEGYSWKSVKIEDPLQFLIEDSFSDYLVSIGVPEKIRKIEVGRDQFMYLFNWVKEDPDARVRYCKTNGSKWKTKWSQRLYEKPRIRT
ncbi:hypothetical protein [Methanocella sp. MCL-LM]|uniref:hypothetical protein n=1 Tax=Methanocella sp. MCL-LM TaxID=3412035 RepID=UPI003C751133